MKVVIVIVIVNDNDMDVTNVNVANVIVNDNFMDDTNDTIQPRTQRDGFQRLRRHSPSGRPSSPSEPKRHGSGYHLINLTGENLFPGTALLQKGPRNQRFQLLHED